MDDGSSAPPDPLRAWLDATGGATNAATGDDQRRSSPVRLLAVTAVASLVALALGAAALSSGTGGHGPTAAAPAPATPAPRGSAAAPVGAAAPFPTPSTAGEVDGSGIPVASGAAAILAVRTTSGPDAYVDTAAVERVEAHDGFNVVTVLAWVLYRQADGWDTGRARRFGVAVTADTGAPLAPPWPLQGETASAPPRTWAAVEDGATTTAAAAAMRAAGYRGLADLEVRSDPALPGVLSARVTATAPGAGSARKHEVWLSGDAAAVLGASRHDPPIPGEPR